MDRRTCSDQALVDWADQQRRSYKRGKLSEPRREALEALAFVWDLEAAEWDRRLETLTQFRQEHGHDNIPNTTPELGELAQWVTRQRRLYKHERLPLDRMERLTAIGFVWEAKEAAWDEDYANLKQYRARFGHCHISPKWSEDPRLKRWVKKQRTLRQKEELEKEKIARLDAIGFVWDQRETLWEEMFSDMISFKEQHGHCNVPENYPENPDLVWWVNVQRKAYSNGTLEQARIERLNERGFIWDPYQALWDDMYRVLQRYRTQYGHCIVQRDSPFDPKLGNWVTTQRIARNKGHMSPENEAKLDALGFLWDAQEAAREELFLALMQFKAQHGHCNVPAQWPENPQLGLWVQFQRQAYKKGTLDQDRFQRLNTLGFVWE